MRHKQSNFLSSTGPYYKAQTKKLNSQQLYDFSGEMDGEGVMCYQDNSKYEGLFHRNYRQGKGVLTESKGKVYQGFFYKDKRHSNGCQIYRLIFSIK